MAGSFSNTWNVTANGTTAAVRFTSGQDRGLEGYLVPFWVNGTFDSATVILEVSFDGGSTYQEVTDGTTPAELSAEGVHYVTLYNGCYVRATTTGVVTASDLTVGVGVA